eukprot:1154838-Pelagomonas_calceolata.AAC.3
MESRLKTFSIPSLPLPQEGLNVFNSANVGSVDGPSKGTNRTSGCGIQREIQIHVPQVAVEDTPPFSGLIGSAASKARIGLNSYRGAQITLVKLAKGFEHILLKLGGSSSNGSCSHVEDLEECRAVTAYEWAIITGGPPNVATEKGCRTGNRPGQLEEQYVGGEQEQHHKQKRIFHAITGRTH